MRILVATTATIPGYSGGWTTTLDLLQPEHEPFYLVTGAKPGLHVMEGVEYLGLGLGGEWNGLMKRLVGRTQRLVTPAAMRWAFRRHRADFVLCLDEQMGLSAMKAGLPYAMRFHSYVSEVIKGPILEEMLDRALFATASQGAEVPGVEIMPHYQDLSRFAFAPPAKPERALLLTCINSRHEPWVFIEGIMGSRDMKGDIVGTGPLRKKMEKACAATGGRVRCLDPVPRLRIGELSGRYQVGVATHILDYPVNTYHMKINTYMACGMHSVVKPFSHVARLAPELVHIFNDAGELSQRLDEIRAGWRELEDRRRKAREWVMVNASVEIPKRRFRELLKESLGGS